MADYHTQCSEAFPEFTKDEKDWTEELLNHLEAVIDEEEVSLDKEEYPLIETHESMSFDWDFKRHLPEPIDHTDRDTTVKTTETVLRGKYSLYISAWEVPNLDLIGEVLHSILAKFDKDDIWKFEWASVCSKLRAGAFGGGALIISKEGVQWQNSRDWCDDKVEEIRASRKS